MLSVRDVRKRYGGVRALQGVSLHVAAGEIVGLIGPNGSGKTTLFDVVTGATSLDGGRVLLDDRDVSDLRPEELARRGLIRTVQVPRVATRMTVLENLLVVRREHPGERLRNLLLPWRAGAVRAADRDLVATCLDLVAELGLRAVADDPAGTLSGGQLKLLSFGMAVMSRPRVLLLDEPAAGVNPSIVTRLNDRILDLRERGVAVCVIEHNMGLVARLCDRVVVLDRGEVIASGTPEQVRADSDVVAAYLGTEEPAS